VIASGGRELVELDASPAFFFPAAAGKFKRSHDSESEK